MQGQNNTEENTVEMEQENLDDVGLRSEETNFNVETRL